jgi:hypothetical protein
METGAKTEKKDGCNTENQRHHAHQFTANKIDVTRKVHKLYIAIGKLLIQAKISN